MSRGQKIPVVAVVHLSAKVNEFIDSFGAHPARLPAFIFQEVNYLFCRRPVSIGLTSKAQAIGIGRWWLLREEPPPLLASDPL